MIVIADTTPLSHIIRIGHAEILPALFGRVVIPPEVRDELAHPNAPDPVRTFAAAPPTWLEVKAPKNPKPLPNLDAAEAAAINLAKQERADLLLIDEHAGRVTATSKEWGLTITGTVGVLERAAEREMLDLPEAFQRLRATRFHVDEKILQDALTRDADRRHPGASA